MEGDVREWISAETAHFQHWLAFAAGRFEEGRNVGEYLLRRISRRPVRCLDVGSGNGGVSLGVANYEDIEVWALDTFLHKQFRELRRQVEIPVKQIVGRGQFLPFQQNSFDAVLCVETLEHMEAPSDLGREIMRVLRPDGICMIATPARFRYVFARDPHYGIPGLLLFPDAIQRLIATRLWSIENYDVEHTYWHVSGVSRLFPGPKTIKMMWNRPVPFRSRLLNRFWWMARSFLWDRIIIEKAR
ncbi:MAG TPA: class I SAM-dependent methyltransferase [Thermoanaerobaculia bacterium]|nr:class I SAM-dependent methyltransferase [Thermoanaerobaculia bacterium]